MKNKNGRLPWLLSKAAVMLTGLFICVVAYSQTPSDNEAAAGRLAEEAGVLITDSLDSDAAYRKLIVADSLVRGSRDSALLTEIHFLQAKCLRKNNPQEALALLEPILAFRKKNFGAQHEKTGDALYVQSFCRMELKMYAQARQGLEETLNIFRQSVGEYHVKSAGTLNLLCVLHLRETGWDAALPYARRAMRIYAAIPPSLYATYPYYNLGLYYSDQRNFPEAVKYFEQSLAIRRQFLSAEHPELYLVLRWLAFCYSESGNLNKAVQLELEGLKIAEKHFGKKSYRYAGSCTHLSFYSWMMERDLPEGIRYAEKAIEIYESIGQGTSSECASAWGHLAICHKYLGNMDKALLYHEKALNIRIRLFGENDCENTYESVNNMAICYNEMGQHEKALSLYKQSLDIRLEHCEKYHPYTALAYNNIGDCYMQLGRYPEALENLLRSVEIFSSPQVEGHFQSCYPLRNLGWYYFNQRDYTAASDYFNKAISTAKKIYDCNNPLVADFMLYAANVKTVQRAFDEAHSLVDSALQIIRFDGNTNRVLSRFTLIDAWQQRAEIFRQQYLATHQTTFLNEARDYSKKSLDLLHSIAVDFTESSSKSEIIRSNYTNYERAVWVENELARLQGEYPETPFTYAERSRSLSLYQSIRESKALRFAGIPDSLLEQERHLRHEMTYFDKVRQEKLNEGFAETDTNVLAVSNLFLILKRRYDALTASLESDFPDYYRLKYKIGTTGIRYLQDTLLRADQSLLEYFVGDSSIFIFTVTRKKYEVREVKLDFPLEKWVRELRKGLYGYHVAHKNLAVLPDSIILHYTEPAYRLYEKLVAPIAQLLAGEVIVVPDGALGYVPFDVLLKKPVPSPPSSRFHTYPYLGNDHAVSYCYSATLLREMADKQHKRRPELNVLAMAPFAPANEELSGEASLTFGEESLPHRRDTLSTLFFSEKEVVAIANMLRGMSLLGTAAGKVTLLENAGRCKMLHLNTHGKADDKVGDYAWLGFRNPAGSPGFDKLFVKDIYDLSLNADLVVLSACETGIGELKRGEGIISLARAFAFAGAKSIVTSLWSVDDKSTGELMQLFYQNLQNGMRKDEAMSKAKRDFRNANKGTKYAHPFFWAGFIPIGDMTPVNRN